MGSRSEYWGNFKLAFATEQHRGLDMAGWTTRYTREFCCGSRIWNQTSASVRVFQIADFTTSTVHHRGSGVHRYWIGLGTLTTSIFQTARYYTRYPANPPSRTNHFWAVDRGKLVTNVRAFVVRTRSGTVTPPRKDYTTGATPVHYTKRSGKGKAVKFLVWFLQSPPWRQNRRYCFRGRARW